MALCLSRQCEETIIINPGTKDEISVTVTEIRGSKVKLAFTAPHHIVIHRAEVVDRLNRERREESA